MLQTEKLSTARSVKNSKPNRNVEKRHDNGFRLLLSFDKKDVTLNTLIYQANTQVIMDILKHMSNTQRDNVVAISSPLSR